MINLVDNTNWMMMIVHCKVTIPKTFYEVHPKHQNIIYIHEGILNLEHISHVSWLAVTVPQEDCRLENCVMLRLGKFLLESLPKNISRVIIPRAMTRKKNKILLVMLIWVVVVMSLDFLNPSLANCLHYINHSPQMKSGNKTILPFASLRIN